MASAIVLGLGRNTCRGIKGAFYHMKWIMKEGLDAGWFPDELHKAVTHKNTFLVFYLVLLWCLGQC